MKTIIKTPRFILRKIDESDLDGMFLLESNPNVYEHLSTFDPITGENLYPPATNKEQVLETIRGIQKQYKETGIGRLAIIEKERNEFVGWCGLKKEMVIRAPETYIDLGYRLREEYWGKGIATETAEACLKYGREELGYTVNAAASKANIASDKVLLKIGLKHIGEFEFMNVPCWYYG